MGMQQHQVSLCEATSPQVTLSVSEVMFKEIYLEIRRGINELPLN